MVGIVRVTIGKWRVERRRAIPELERSYGKVLFWNRDNKQQKCFLCTLSAMYPRRHTKPVGDSSMVNNPPPPLFPLLTERNADSSFWCDQTCFHFAWDILIHIDQTISTSFTLSLRLGLLVEFLCLLRILISYGLWSSYIRERPPRHFDLGRMSHNIYFWTDETEPGISN
jgi:hypothetical protein